MSEFRHERPTITGIDVELWRRELHGHTDAHDALQRFEQDSDDYLHYMLEARRQMIHGQTPDLAWIRYVGDEYFDSFRQTSDALLAFDGQSPTETLAGILSIADRRQCRVYNVILGQMGATGLGMLSPKGATEEIDKGLHELESDDIIEATFHAHGFISRFNLGLLLNMTFED